MSTTTAGLPCQWCGMIHTTICPAVKAIEFHADGVTVKRVEFKTANDYAPWPNSPGVTYRVGTVGPYFRPNEGVESGF